MARKVSKPGKGATGRCPSIPEVAAMLEDCDRETLESCREALKSDTRKGIVALIGKAERRLDRQDAELARVRALYDFETALARERGAVLWAGLDEVGRGPLAGPVAAGCVILDLADIIPGLNDSKQVAPEVRLRVAEEIKRRAVAWSVAFVDNAYIDAHGMVRALKLAFTDALSQVEASAGRCDIVLLDGNPLGFDTREVNIVKGDAKCASIAAASIIAKVARDELMERYALEYPEYGWEKNKGYASAEHMDAIREHGLTPLHRASFCTGFSQLTLF